MELKEELEKLKQQLEEEATKHHMNCHVLDIKYYKPVTFDQIKGKEQPLYLVEKEVNGKTEKQLQLGDMIIADIVEGNSIQIREEFSHLLKEQDILIELKNTMPTSLNHLEKEQEEKRESEPQKEANEELQQDSSKEIDEAKTIDHNPKDAEIDMDKKITATKTFADLVPEVKEKQIEKVRVRRLDGTRFEFYGEDSLGQEVAIESLRMVEGTNQKRTEKDIQEFAQKERNPEVNDNIERANRILEEQDSTSIENVDDDLNNDRPETQAEYENSLIQEAAKRCKISETGFRKILEQERREGEPIEDSIERAEDEINEQVIGERRR